ncbi:positive regulator of sigma(E) RseC/MucC [Bacteroides sp. CAG:443]|nr:positive regulator of sigma(E) RseC/MucC [Bacteroides sp. CAG:443]
MENINGSRLKVKIVQSSACSACSVKGHCSASETKEKIIDVYNKNNVPCQVGERVMIVGTTSMGMKAVLLAFVLPFIVLLLALIISLKLTGGDEAVSALVSLGTLVPYYLIIYICRNRLSRSFMFILESIYN